MFIFGMRISKSENWNCRNAINIEGQPVLRTEGTRSIFYVRDYAGTILGEVELNDTNVTGLKAYTYGTRGLISERDIINSVSYWYNYGVRGETKAILNQVGQLVNEYIYDAYGSVVSKTEQFRSIFLFSSKYGCISPDNDELMFCGNRWYSSRLKGWLSPEGDDNLYEYVNSSPISYVDPNGLDELAVPDKKQIKSINHQDQGYLLRGLLVKIARCGRTLIVIGAARNKKHLAHTKVKR